jgi:hypothetical protein
MNNRRELELLELDIENLKNQQRRIEYQAHQKEKTLRYQQHIIREMLSTEFPEMIDEETLLRIVTSIRQKIKILDI